MTFVHRTWRLGLVLGGLVVAAALAVPVFAAEAETGVAPERKLIAGAVLVVALVVLFAASWLWRRMNPA